VPRIAGRLARLDVAGVEREEADELAEDVSQVSLDGLYAEEELGGDLGVGAAVDH
jgi:hypothetical protein